MINENRVTISGSIDSILEFSHEMYGEKFYKVELACRRKSGAYDRVKVMLSDHIINAKRDYMDEYVEITGEFRSYNKLVNGRKRLELFVFAQTAEFFEGEDVPLTDKNEICLVGHITKVPVFRKTPLSREITDIVLAVNRAYGRTSYISCICWSRNATFAANLKVGDTVTIKGRIQSREYVKKISETEADVRTAYEVSISWIKLEGRE